MRKVIAAVFCIAMVFMVAGCTSANLEKWFELDVDEQENGQQQEEDFDSRS